MAGAPDDEPTFGRQVLSRAWFNAWAPIKDRRLDIVLGLVGAVLAIGHATKTGWTWTYPDFLGAVVSLFAPFVAVWVVLFVWHFWLAPSAIAYEAAKAAHKRADDAFNKPQLIPASAPAQGAAGLADAVQGVLDTAGAP